MKPRITRLIHEPTYARPYGFRITLGERAHAEVWYADVDEYNEWLDIIEGFLNSIPDEGIDWLAEARTETARRQREHESASEDTP